MYQQQDTLSVTQKKRLRQKSSMVRQLILRLRDDLQLEPTRPASSRMVAGPVHHPLGNAGRAQQPFLEGYGQVPEELAHYLDPIGEKLTAEMNEISLMFSRLDAGSTDE